MIGPSKGTLDRRMIQHKTFSTHVYLSRKKHLSIILSSK